MKEKILNIARIVVLSFILSTAIGYSLADWAPPPACGAPPCGNTPPPINVGAAPQMRDGMLFVNNRLYATKAETQSTVGAVGCVPGPGCDSGTTLTTKDYVDGRGAARRVFTTVNVINNTPGANGYPACGAEPGHGPGGLQWVLACGNRYCRQQIGYVAGNVVEFSGLTLNDPVEVSCVQ